MLRKDWVRVMYIKHNTSRDIQTTDNIHWAVSHVLWVFPSGVVESGASDEPVPGNSSFQLQTHCQPQHIFQRLIARSKRSALITARHTASAMTCLASWHVCVHLTEHHWDSKTRALAAQCYCSALVNTAFCLVQDGKIPLMILISSQTE